MCCPWLTVFSVLSVMVQITLLFSTTEAANFNFYDCSESNSSAPFMGHRTSWEGQGIADCRLQMAN